MRISSVQVSAIKEQVRLIAGEDAGVRVFGSRLDDAALGGDLDLMLELPKFVDNPALLSARVAVQVSRVMNGRRVDVILSAPNLMRLPIHDVAFTSGLLL